MSINKRVQQGFLRLPFAKKAILISSALLMISPVLPWYESRTSVGVIDSFSGLKGPLFLVGVLCLSFGAITFFNLFLPLLGKNFFKLRKKSGAVSAILGMQALFLLIIANSVFFHPDFGVNVGSKGTRFGMILSFAATSTMLLAGWLTHRKEKSGEIEDFDDFIAHPEPVQVNNVQYPAQTMPQAIQSRPVPQEVPSAFVGDPLTLDAKTRYKLMRAQQRQSQDAQGNLWGSPRVTQNEAVGRNDI